MQFEVNFDRTKQLTSKVVNAAITVVNIGCVFEELLS